MRVPDATLDAMHARAGLPRGRLHEALRLMGPKRLKTRAMRAEWTPSNPTKNYCYVVAELVFYYLAPLGSTSWLLRGAPGSPYAHRFVKWPDGSIVDLAVHQFDSHEAIDYNRARRWGFMHTGRAKAPSRRCRELAALCGVAMTRDRANHFGFTMPEG